MVWLPAASALVLIMATPEARATFVTSTVEVVWSVKVTVPVGTPLLEETVAVKVSAWPYTEDVGKTVSVVVVGITVCATADEVLPTKEASPE